MLAGLAGIAGGVASFGQAPLGAGLLVAVAGAAGQGERSGVPVVCLAGLAGGQQGFPRPVERLGFPAGVADVLVQGQGLLTVTGGLTVKALTVAGLAEAVKDSGLFMPVAGLAGEV